MRARIDRNEVVAAAKPTPSGIAPPEARGSSRGIRLLPNPARRGDAEELVTVTIDDREVEVAEGDGARRDGRRGGDRDPGLLLRAAARARRSAPAACASSRSRGCRSSRRAARSTAQDGMVVRTAATSERAADGQQGTLEFILVNHPLDCPVCDKGGECPLQDLTFRYGPGSTRMTFPKLTFDKPIPVSPLIALDRERCILCYRCTRFSSDVAEDGQLIARNRGAHTEIATFGEDPYRAPFSGNVIELCPVGALTSTQYRFEARPWEIQDVPTVCGLCPVGCNIRATTREGAVKRVQSRNHPEVDGGWICDKGRFTFPHLRAEDRMREPLVARRARARARRRGTPRSTAPRSCSAAPAARDRHRALGLGDDRDRLRARDAACGAASARTRPCCPSRPRRRSTRSGRRSRRSATPRSSSSSATTRSSTARPVVDLWLRQGAPRTAPRSSRSALAAPCRRRRAARPTALAELVAVAERARQAAARIRARGADLVGPGRRRRRAPRRGGRTRSASRTKPGCAAFHLPATPNARGVAEAWAVRGRRGRGRAESDRPARRLRRRGRVRPGRPRARREGGRGDRDHDVPLARRRLGRPRAARRPRRSSARARR